MLNQAQIHLLERCDSDRLRQFWPECQKGLPGQPCGASGPRPQAGSTRGQVPRWLGGEVDATQAALWCTASTSPSAQPSDADSVMGWKCFFLQLYLTHEVTTMMFHP